MPTPSLKHAPLPVPRVPATSDAPASRRLRGQAFAWRHPLAMIVVGLTLYSTGPVMGQASGVDGPVFSFWRLWFGVPVLGAAAVLMLRAGGRWPDRQAWRWPLWAGLCFAAHQLFFFSAIKATSVTDVALMNVLSPILVALVAVPLFGERPGRRFRAWTLLAMVGAAIVVLGASAGPQGDPWGMTMAAANITCFAGFFLLSKRGRSEIDVLPFLFGAILTAALAVSAFAVVTAQPIMAVERGDMLLALVVAAGPGALGHFLSTWPLQRLPANLPPVMRLAQPILSGVLAYLFLAEPIRDTHLAGGLLTMLGVFGAVRSPGWSLPSTAQGDQQQGGEVERGVEGDGGPQRPGALVQQRRNHSHHERERKDRIPAVQQTEHR